MTGGTFRSGSGSGDSSTSSCRSRSSDESLCRSSSKTGSFISGKVGVDGTGVGVVGTLGRCKSSVDVGDGGGSVDKSYGRML